MGIIVEDTAASIEAAKIIQNEKPMDFTVGGGMHQNKVVQDHFYGLRAMPEGVVVNSPAGVVFFNLAQCFALADNIEEGPIENVMSGFHVSGIQASTVMDGFVELYRLQYVDFVDAYGTAMLGTVNEKTWYKITPRFLHCVAKSKDQALKNDKDMGKNATQALNFIDKLTATVHDDKKIESIDTLKL